MSRSASNLRGSTTKARAVRDIVARLCKEFDRRAVLAGLIRYWLNACQIRDAQIPCDGAARYLIELSIRSDANAVQRELRNCNGAISLDDLERAFESCIDGERRRDHGVVYTPDFIVEYLLREAIKFVGHRSTPPTVCDPACGSGGFVRRAAELISRRHRLRLADVFRQYVVGIDRDEVGLAHARCLIELQLAANGEFVAADELRLIRADTLLADPQELMQKAGCELGIDIVATNPPYVKLQNLPVAYREQLIDRYKAWVKGSFGLAPLFLLAGHRLLAPGGCLAYITQNNLFTSLSGEPIRRHLQERRCVRRIIDFGHARVFPGASAYTCLMFLGTEPAGSFEFDALGETPTMSALAAVRPTNIHFDRLDAKKWRLAPGRHFENLHKIETSGQPLREIADIRVGFATLRDAVFLVREVDDRCYATATGGQLVEVEREITRGAVKIADMESEDQIVRTNTRIIFPYCKRNGRYQVIGERELQERFPKAYRHLRESRDMLARRDKGKRNSEAWYAWGRAQGREALGPKLLTKTFDTQPNFMLDPSDRLFCNGYSVSLKRRVDLPPNLTIEVLQRILNSRVMHYYARLTSFQIEGGYQCYQKNFIERFGVPQLTEREIEKLHWSSAAQTDVLLSRLYNVRLKDVNEILA